MLECCTVSQVPFFLLFFLSGAKGLPSPYDLLLSCYASLESMEQVIMDKLLETMSTINSPFFKKSTLVILS